MTEIGATLQPLLEFLLLSFRLQGRVVGMLQAERRDFNLTPTEIIALLWLSLGSSPVSDVAKAVGLRPNGASILVQRLLARHLIKRQRSRHDRRVVTVLLTDAGRSLASALSAKLNDELRSLLSPLSASEQEQLLSMLRPLASP